MLYSASLSDFRFFVGFSKKETYLAIGIGSSLENYLVISFGLTVFSPFEWKLS